MKPAWIVCLMSVVLASGAVAGPLNFESDYAGGRPKGWRCASTGGGEAVWKVETVADGPVEPGKKPHPGGTKEGGIKVLRQSGNGANPWCVHLNERLEDGSLEVWFRILGGKEAQEAGLLWRQKDVSNFYALRLDARTGQAALSFVTLGRWATNTPEPGATPAKLDLGRWYRLKIDLQGDRYTVFLDGKKVSEGANAAISGPGGIGVVTRGDTAAEFTGFVFHSLSTSP